MVAVWVWIFALQIYGAPTNYFELDAARFKAIAAQVMVGRSLNYDLLEAAILRETNERRAKVGLTALKTSPKATAFGNSCYKSPSPT